MQTLHLSAFMNRSPRTLRTTLALVGIGVGLLALLRPERPASHSMPMQIAPIAPASIATPRHKTSVPGGPPSAQNSTASAIAELKRRGLYTSLQQAMQAALYRVEPEQGHAGNYTADNPAQRYSVQFDAADIAVRAGSDRHASHSLRLRLSGVEAGGDKIALTTGRLRAKGERMEYDRGVVQEWYANTPQGLEQGFTVLHKPVSGKQGNLQIRLAVSGDWQGHLSQDRQWVDFKGSKGGSGLRYGKLQAWDACGHRLGSHLKLSGSELALAVDTRQAAYPVRIDPLIVGAGTEVMAGDAAQNNYFGNGISVSGNMALIGAPGRANDTGVAYVFVQSGGVWLQQAELTASDGTQNDWFGAYVSLSGNTALIGAPGYTNASAPGAAYIFVQSGGAWAQQAKLTASDAASGDYFGDLVGLNGNTAVIGASGKASNTGAAYVFVGNNGVWTQQAKLTASDTVLGDEFGSAISVSGNTVLIGAQSKANNTGAAYIFVQSGSTWTQQAKLTASDGAAGDYFGWWAGLDGNIALVSAPSKANNTGAAYVFVGNNGVWTQQAKLTASDGAAGDYFGYSVGLSGNTALIGASGKTSNTGVAYVFVGSGGSWTQQQELFATDGTSGGFFGYSVSLSGNTALVGAYGKVNFAGAFFSYQIGPEQTASDGAQNDSFGSAVSMSGNTVLIGAPNKVNSDGSTGAAYVFVQKGGIWTPQAEWTPGYPGGQLGRAVSLSGDTALVSAPDLRAVVVFVRNGGVWTGQQLLYGSDSSFGQSLSISGNTALIGAPFNSNANGSEGTAYLFVRSGVVWSQQAILAASDEAQGDEFGYSVSLSGNTALIGAPGKASSGINVGAAYVFVGNNGVWTQQVRLAPSSTGGEFGSAVSVSGDTALVGAPGQNAAYVFVQNGGSWTQQTILTVNYPGYYTFQFGESVSLSGNMAVIGASDTNYTIGSGTFPANVGAVHRFVRNNGVWILQQAVTASDAAPGDHFGQTLSLSGSAILVGTPGKATSTGAVYLLGQSLLAQADTYTAYVNTPLSLNAAQGVLANDTDPFALPLTALLIVPPANGSLTFNPDGSFVYTPDTNFSGTDTFAYQATDGSGTSDLTWVTLNVITPIPPVIVDLDPTKGAAGGFQMALWVNGMDFTNSSVVSVNGTPVSTLCVSDTQLLAVVPASYLSTPTTLSIQVTNPQPNGASNTVSLPVVSFLASVSTPTFVIGGSSTTLTLHLSPAAPLGGLPIAVSSNQPLVAQPVASQVTVPTGQPSMMVTVNTTAVTKQTTVKLTGSVGGVSASASLIVLPPQQQGNSVLKLPQSPPSPHSPGLHG